MSEAFSKCSVICVAEIEMVLVPAGEFTMGSPADEPLRDEDQGPQHMVRITRPFYVGKYPVTQGQWQKVMGNNRSNFTGSDRLPVESISWNDCQEFCRRAGNGVRLPTEAEWEYACRAGTSTRFSFGHDYAALGEHAWFYLNSDARTHEVGEKKPNEWGLYDIHGNVWEWCQSFYVGYPYREDDGREDVRSFGDRVLRGGAWCDPAESCRSFHRRGRVSTYRRADYGFRVVAPAPE